MITENEQFQIEQSSQVDQSLSQMLQEEFQPLLEEGLSNELDLERYLSNEYSIFKRDELTLNQLCLIKNKMDVESLNYAVLAYFCQSNQTSGQQDYYSKNKSQISSQFSINLKNVPMHSIVYLSIREHKDNRFNMLARNSRGECLSYFWKQRKCKKIQKILKFLSNIRKPLMVVILDQTIQATANILQIEKISSIADEFVYILNNAKHITLNIEDNDLQSEEFIEGYKKCCLQRNQNQLRIYSPNLSLVSEGQIVNFLIQTCKTLEEEQISALQVARGQRSQEQRNLPLDFIFINVFRVQGCSPKQVIVIISNLLMKQQQTYNKKIKKSSIQKDYDPQQHYPKILSEGKSCWLCTWKNKQRSRKSKKKTKIICEGCSAEMREDIRLCPEQCFIEFHHNIEHYKTKMKNQKKRRSKRKRLQQKKEVHEKIQNPLILQPSTNQKINQLPSFQERNAEDQQSADTQKFSNQMIEKTKKLDSLLEQNFNNVKKLRDFGRFDILSLFLGASLNYSIKKMKDLSTKNPQHNTGLTKVGSKVAQQIQKMQQYNNTQLKEENRRKNELITHKK